MTDETKAACDVFARMLENLPTDEDRKEAIDTVFHAFCVECGKVGEHCYCWRDE